MRSPVITPSSIVCTAACSSLSAKRHRSGSSSSSPRLRSAPVQAKERRHGVRGGFLPLEPFVIVARHRAVRRLILVSAVRGDEYARHQAQAAERRGHHVAHHVAVIVFARPDEAALGAHHARHGVVDQRVEILDAGFLKLFLIVSVINFLENILEAVIVDLRNGVLRGKPQIPASCRAHSGSRCAQSWQCCRPDCAGPAPRPGL